MIVSSECEGKRQRGKKKGREEGRKEKRKEIKKVRKKEGREGNDCKKKNLFEWRVSAYSTVSEFLTDCRS